LKKKHLTEQNRILDVSNIHENLSCNQMHWLFRPEQETNMLASLAMIYLPDIFVQYSGGAGYIISL
jgi:hypothetical protein